MQRELTSISLIRNTWYGNAGNFCTPCQSETDNKHWRSVSSDLWEQTEQMKTWKYSDMVCGFHYSFIRYDSRSLKKLVYFSYNKWIANSEYFSLCPFRCICMSTTCMLLLHWLVFYLVMGRNPQTSPLLTEPEYSAVVIPKPVNKYASIALQLKFSRPPTLVNTRHSSIVPFVHFQKCFYSQVLRTFFSHSSYIT